jgi:hypothetical protein
MVISEFLQRPIIYQANPPSEFYEENRLQKLTRRLKEEPLIPFGTYSFPIDFPSPLPVPFGAEANTSPAKVAS